jgi:hypothetical protein
MSTPVVYKSSDTSAPVLTGQAGSLVTVLDNCLVNGYGSKAAAGWTKSYSGTNAASYRMAAGNQFYLDVNDNNPNGTSLGKESAIRGYEVMTALATGTGPFPTTAQVANPGLRVRKSTSADATARAWVLIADDRTFYMFVKTSDISGRYYAWGFGDFYSFKSADGYRCFIKAGVTMNSSSSAEDLVQQSPAPGSNAPGLYVPRISAGTGAGVAYGLAGMLRGNTTPYAPFPNPSDGGLYLTRIMVMQPAADVRGYMRGWYELMTGINNLNDGDTFSGTGDFTGRTFLVVSGDAVNGQAMVVETTAWDTSS